MNNEKRVIEISDLTYSNVLHKAVVENSSQKKVKKIKNLKDWKIKGLKRLKV